MDGDAATYRKLLWPCAHATSGGDLDEEVNVYTDASWATEIENTYSASGMATTAYGTVIAWKSCRQTIRAESTCTAEYIAAAEAVVCAELRVWSERDGRLEFGERYVASGEQPFRRCARRLCSACCSMRSGRAELAG